MANKKHQGEPVGWVTIKGVHFPKWKDGTIGWQSGEEKLSSHSQHDFQKAIREAKTKEDISKIIKEAGNSGLSEEAMNKVMGTAYDRGQQLKESTHSKKSKPADYKSMSMTALNSIDLKSLSEEEFSRLKSETKNISQPGFTSFRAKVIEESNRRFFSGGSPSSKNSKYDTSRLATNQRRKETKESLQKEYNELHAKLGYTENPDRIAAINRRLDIISKKLDDKIAEEKKSKRKK